MRIAEQIQDTEDAGKISAWRANADQKASEFSDSLLSRQDPDKWGEDWKSIREGLGQDLNNLGLSPRAKERAQRDFDMWASDRTSHFSTQSAVRKVSESKARIGGTWRYYAERGDRAGMEATKQDAIASGVFPQSQVEEMTRESDRIAAIGEVRRTIESSPLDAGARITEAGANLTIEDQDRLNRMAEIQTQTFQRKALQDISGKIERREFATEEDLKRALDGNRYIEPGLHDEVVFNFQQSQPLDAETKFALTDQLNDLHDDFKAGKLTMDQYRMEHDRISQVVYSLGARDGSGALRQRTHALDPAAWNGDNLKEGRAEAKRRTIQQVGKLYHENGAFGEVDKEAMPAERAKQAQDAFQRRERVEGAMERWSDANPDASDDQLNEQFRKTYLGEFADSIIAPVDSSEVDRLRKWLNSETPAAGGYGNRPDGTAKGRGWLGEISLPDGSVATEYTMQSDAVQVDGKRVDFPTLVPTLTPEEVELMRSDIIPNKKDIPEAIIQKAIEHAKGRLSKGESVFAPGDGPQGASNSTSDRPLGGNLVEVVKHFEAGGAPGGFHAKAYWDNKQWSIGYGTKSKQGETITKAEAESRLHAELAEARDQVIVATGGIGMPLEDQELDALTSFQFNTGRIDQLLAGGTRSKAEVASKMLLYKNASGQPMRGLERRRIAESTLFRRGYAN